MAEGHARYSTVTDLARLRGWSTWVPFISATNRTEAEGARWSQAGGIGPPARRDVFGQASQFMVTFGGYADDPTLAGHDFLHIAGGLVVVTALGTDDHHRHILIDERDGSCFISPAACASA